MGVDPDDMLPLGGAAFLAAAAAPPLAPEAVAHLVPAAAAPAVAVAVPPPQAAPLAPLAEASIPACFATLPPLKSARGERGAAAAAKGGLSATYFTEGAHLTAGHGRISGDGNMASGASSGLRGVGKRRNAGARQHPPSVLKVSVARCLFTSYFTLGPPVAGYCPRQESVGEDLRLSRSATRQLMKNVGGVYVPAKSTVQAGQNQKSRPDIVCDRVVAGREWKRIQHKVIKPAPEDRAAVTAMLRGKKEGDVFTTAEQQLMNVQLRWWAGD